MKTLNLTDAIPKLRSVLLMAALAGCLESNAQALQWAKALTGDLAAGRSVATDAAGNIYTTGNFEGTVDFDPGPGVFNLVSEGSNDIYVSKLNASGNFVWAKRIGGTQNDRSRGIALDAGGNIYIVGMFQAGADFDPDTGVFNLFSEGGSDVFISKLDASGNFVWANRMGGTGDDGVYNNAIAVDAAGSVYTTGYFQGTADFDVFNLASAGDYDIFISKLDASGNFLWAMRMGGTGWDDGWGIAVDAAGNIYTTGAFEGTVDFDPGTGIFNLTAPTPYYHTYVSKIDAAGNFVWARHFAGANNSVGYSITLDAASNVYTVGAFGGTADFDPGAGFFNLASAGGVDIFISKLDVSGNFVWAKRMGGTGSDYGTSVATDAAGNVYTTGYFSGTADFDPGTGVFNLFSAGNYDAYISKLDASGNFAWARRFGGAATGGDGDVGYSIVTDVAGNVYTTGFFQQTAGFDPPDTIMLTTTGLYGAFVIKYSDTGLGFADATDGRDIALYPNPAGGTFTIGNLETGTRVRITDLAGKTVHSSVAENSEMRIEGAAFHNGVYIIQLEDRGGVTGTKKLIVHK